MAGLDPAIQSQKPDNNLSRDARLKAGHDVRVVRNGTWYYAPSSKRGSDAKFADANQ
jgi:hypothetical protein